MGVLVLVALPAGAQSTPASPEAIAVGDWQLWPELELRARGEYRRAPVDVGGAPLGVVNDAYGALERARLGVAADHGAVRAKLTLEDAHAWGSFPTTATPPTVEAPGELGAYEAYLEMHTSTAHPSFLRIGRQAVTWGEGRLISDADWSPTGRSLDAIRGRLAYGRWGFELLGAILEAQRPLGAAFGDTAGPASGGQELAGVKANLVIDPLFRLEAVAISRVAEGANGPLGAGASRFLFAKASGETYVGSLRAFGEGRGWRYGIEAAYELGRATSLNDDARQAYAWAAHVSRTFDTVLLTPSFGLAASYASGDDGGATYRQFNPLLPDVHTWHGAMNVFAWSNEMEASARASIVPWTDTAFAVEYRYAELVEPSADWMNAYLGVVGRAPGSKETGLGQELDLTFDWRPWPVLDLLAGYSALLLGDGARTILANPAVARGTLEPNATFAPAAVSHLAYLQATVRMP